MSLSMYQDSVLFFLPGLKNLSATLNKAEAHATERKINPTVPIPGALRESPFRSRVLHLDQQIQFDIIQNHERLSDRRLPWSCD